MLTTLKNNQSLTFYQQANPHSGRVDSSYTGGLTAYGVANVAVAAQIRTGQITKGFSDLVTAVIERGKAYAGNSVASRGGFMAEEFVAQSYNLDAILKKIDGPKAQTLKSTADASADIKVGDQTASLKFYSDANASAKAQLDPKYGSQKRIIPGDQLADGKAAVADIAAKNQAKGRTNVAEQQTKIGSELLDDRLRTDNGVESTPLTKKQDMDMARAIKKGEDKTVTVDEKQIKDTIKQTGITRRVERAILKNELCGLGIAVAIGSGVGFTIGFVTTLAQSGVSPDTIKSAAIQGAKSGIESGIISGVGYGIGRTIGKVATQAVTGQMRNIGMMMTDNLITMVNMGVVGVLTTTVFSAYQFIKLKHCGITTHNALLQVGQQAMFSLSLLAVSIAAQGAWGGCAGIVVSVSIGIIFITYSVVDMVQQRRISEKVRVYMIDKCCPVFSV